MASSDRLEPLRHAVAADPANGGLRLVYADALTKDGRFAEASLEYQTLFVSNDLPADQIVRAGLVAVRAGAYSFASSLAAHAQDLGDVAGSAELQIEVNEALERASTQPADGESPGHTWFHADARAASTTFADIGGLAEVKKAIERLIILPFRQTEIYQRYGRKAGGGLLLYGPPGCGKTLLARATASECGLPFLNIRIEDVLNPYFGVSERNLHSAFAHARAAAPCVVFLDELDAIGLARRRLAGGSARSLVDQLLQELDAIGADNTNMLVLAATNVPWDVDEALKRPGRFDRSVFVPPPDREARETILAITLRGRPATGLDLRRLAEQTRLFSGADLAGLVERATDRAIDAAITTGHERPLSMSDFDNSLRDLVPSTLEWIATARRYVEFANDTGRYNDVQSFLRSGEAKP